MTDHRGHDDNALPWLQAVDDEDEPQGVSARKMLAALAVVLLAAMIVAATFFWLGRREAEVAGAPELIRAEPGPYKVKPVDPGGLDVTGESETAFQTSAGEDHDAQLDLSKVPGGAPPPPPPPAEAKPEAPAAPPKPPEPKPTGAAGSVVQLGAFQNQAQAERAWTALSGRFPSVSSTTKLVVPFPGGIRLRADAGSPAAARELCQALKAAGENCFVAR